MVFTTPITKRGDFAFFIIVFSRVFQGQKKIVFTFPLTKRGDFANEKRRFRVFNNPLTLPLTSLTSGLRIRRADQICTWGMENNFYSVLLGDKRPGTADLVLPPAGRRPSARQLLCIPSYLGRRLCLLPGRCADTLKNLSWHHTDLFAAA